MRQLSSLAVMALRTCIGRRSDRRYRAFDKGLIADLSSRDAP